jgi:hypothetical protein
VDLEGAEPKVLVDHVSTDFTITTALAPPSPPPSAAAVVDEDMIDPEGVSWSDPEDLVRRADTAVPADEDNDWDENIPPPPDAFPEDWGILEPGVTAVSTASLTTQKERSQPVIPKPDLAAAPVDLPAVVESNVQQKPDSIPMLPDLKAPPKSIDQSIELPKGVSYILPPEPAEDGSAIHMITVFLRPSGDQARDVLRVRRIHGLATSYPGQDRFALKIYERNRGYLVEFPNLTTRYCPELMATLHLLVGQDNVRVEPITFQ